MPYPGFLSRLETATGLLVRSVKINSHYLFVENCNVNQEQDIDMTYLVQGGPGSGIANIGAKKITGEITFPIRVDRNGDLDPAVLALLRHAESPATALRLDTNHVLAHMSVSAENGGTSDNELLSLDSMLVTDLTIRASPDDEVKITARVVGMVDARDPSDYVAPASNQLLGRTLSWGDCDGQRLESDMRTISSIELNIANEAETPAFLLPYGTSLSERSDQISLVGVKSIKWSGKFEEILRLGADQETHIHNGWMVGENLQLRFGPITAIIQVPLFKMGEAPLSSKTLKRTTSFFAQILPSKPNLQGGLFSMTE